MFAVSEVAPGSAGSGQSQSQQQVVASVIALQRVIASQSSAEGKGSSSGNLQGGSDGARQARASERSRANLQDAAGERSSEPREEASADARSIVEAQEASMSDKKITAAFHERYGLADLLSVIRDPEDRMFPHAPGS